MADESWRNWMGETFACRASPEPESLDELRTIVARDAGARRRIRAAGAGCSWSPLVPVGDTIVRMTKLRRPLRWDEAAQTIEVEAGMSIEELDREARRRNMTLVSPTLFPTPTVGGAISTGSHGTDFAAGGFADGVVALTIVDAGGNVRTVGPGNADLPAARVALGTLGIVYSVTLRLVPQYPVEVLVRDYPLQRVIDELPDLQASCQFLEMFWFPFTDVMRVYVMRRPDDRVPVDRMRWYRKKLGDLYVRGQEFAADRVIPWMARHAPRLTPRLVPLASTVSFEEGVSVQHASDAFHFQRAYARCHDMEYAVPASEAERACRAAIDLVDHYGRAELYPVNFALHVRFSGASAAWLSPAYGRPTCHIEVATAHHTPHWDSYFRQLERQWLQIPGARPHWGKDFGMENRKTLGSRYPKLGDFLAVRDRWDPERVFLNSFLEDEIFQLGPRRAHAPPPPSDAPSPAPTALPPLPPPTPVSSPRVSP